ncbi:MAG: hypothetical protein KAI47_10495 [Deltaproteobacteria bacterium]|nr:hypothetical protein [Deltaproteobacteria bacterium]
MLEHVAAQQTRFVAPGLAPDTRGVAMGRFVAVLLPSIDRVVALFRGLSEKMSIDELLPTLRIVQVRTPLSSRELIVQVAVGSSYAADSVAAVVQLVGGLTFTGSAKHFVAYRDTRSPLGYDVDALHAGRGDFVLYAKDFVQVYEAERDLDFARLAQTLSLQRERDEVILGDDVSLLRVVSGLYRPVLTYLHRSGVVSAAAAAELPSTQTGGDAARVFLLRCERLPARMVALFRETPGVEVLRLVISNVAVQVGYRHPFELSACSTIFEEERFYLYSGETDCLDTLASSPEFVDARTIVEMGPLRQIREAPPLAAAAADAVRVDFRLVAVGGARPRVVASRIPMGEAERFKRLIYLLPPNILARYEICITEAFIYLLCGTGVDFIPLGEMFWALTPEILVPNGFSLLPRVAPEVLHAHLKASDEQIFFFVREHQSPLRLARRDFAPLGRHILAEVIVREVGVAPLASEAGSEAVSLINDELGPFPLWHFAGDLPAPSTEDTSEANSESEGGE